MKAHWRSGLVPCWSCGAWQPFQGSNEGCFPERRQGETLRHDGNLKDLGNMGTAGKAVGQLCGLAFVSPKAKFRMDSEELTHILIQVLKSFNRRILHTWTKQLLLVVATQ